MKYKEYYFDCHCHDCYSARDGVSQPKDLIKRASELGFKRYIPTNHGNISSLFDTFKECEKYNIKAGIGCEFYFTTRERSNHENAKLKREVFHLTVTVKNDIGYKNLLRLLYISHLTDKEQHKLDTGEFVTGAMYYRSRITEDVLFKLSDGLIVSSGCQASVFNKLILNDEVEEAEKMLLKFKNNIKDFFIELHVADAPAERKIFHELKRIAYKYNIPTIIANDSHYVWKDDLKIWNIFIEQRFKNKDKDDFDKISNKDFHMKSYEEALESTFKANYHSRLKQLEDEIKEPYNREQWLRNNEEQFNKEVFEESCKLFKGFKLLDEMIEFNWFGDWKSRKLPNITFDNIEEAFKKEMWNKLKSSFKDLKVPTEYLERLKYEWEIAQKTNNINYFYLTNIVLKTAKKKGIMLNMGRGSAGSLLLGWLIEAHKVDPLKYGFIVERAMNVDRPKLMDIDLDFAPNERPLVIEVIKEIFGADKVAEIITYNFCSIKQAIQTVGQYLNIPPFIRDQISKSVETLEDLKNNEFVRSYRNEERNLNSNDLVELISKVIGSMDKVSIHASGILICQQPIWELVPTYKIKDSIVCAFDMGMLEELNGLKLDCLILGTMSNIRDTLIQIHKNNQ